MKKALLALVVSVFYFQAKAQNLPSIHSLTTTNIDGYKVPFTQFYGKKVLFVNTASFCAYTPQYGLLEQLYQNYKKYNFVILGFPCNDFGAQDPFADSTIKYFCTSNYGVTFPLMHKISIKTGDTDQVYRWLQQANLNGVKNVSVDWNFNKFLINESGNWVAHHSSQTSPLDPAIINWILSPSSISPAGIKQMQEDGSFTEMVSPNPTSQSIELIINQSPLSDFTIRVISIDGREVKNINGNLNAGSEKIGFEVNDLEPGVYFVTVSSNRRFKNFKVVVE